MEKIKTLRPLVKLLLKDKKKMLEKLESIAYRNMDENKRQQAENRGLENKI